MLKITEYDIFRMLSTSVGKSVPEIREQIRTEKGLSRSFLSDLRLPFGSLYVKLHNLEKEGYVSSRWRETSPEVLERRGGNRPREYLRIEGKDYPC
jgi:DNA-binding PadR family transcriptional regulator